MELLVILIALALAVYYLSSKVLFILAIVFAVLVASVVTPETEKAHFQSVAFIIAGLYVALMALWFDNTNKDFSFFSSLVAFFVCGSLSIVLSIAFLYPLWNDFAYQEVTKGWWIFSTTEIQPRNQLTQIFGLTGMIAGPVEEFAKLLALVVLLKKRVVSRKTGVYYAVLCAIGFAMIENVSYFVRYGEVLPIRANPAHAVFSAIWGAALGSYYAREKGLSAVLWGLTLGMSLHAVWNLFASINSPLFVLIFIFVALSGLAFIRRELKEKNGVTAAPAEGAHA